MSNSYRAALVWGFRWGSLFTTKHEFKSSPTYSQTTGELLPESRWHRTTIFTYKNKLTGKLITREEFHNRLDFATANEDYSKPGGWIASEDVSVFAGDEILGVAYKVTEVKYDYESCHIPLDLLDLVKYDGTLPKGRPLWLGSWPGGYSLFEFLDVPIDHCEWHLIVTVIS